MYNMSDNNKKESGNVNKNNIENNIEDTKQEIMEKTTEIKKKKN